jgi:hypothetical protein
MQIAEILEKTGQTETMVLREHAILTILTKLSRYESECALFEKKYGALIASWKVIEYDQDGPNLRLKAEFEFTDGSRFFVRHHKHIMSGNEISVEASRGGDLETIFDEIAHRLSSYERKAGH